MSKGWIVQKVKNERRCVLTYLLVKIHVIQNSVRIVAGVALHAGTLIA